jgi:hypothetical protein
LPRSRSHNRPTNPRNKPQLKATRKRSSRSKGLRQSRQPGADRPRGGADHPQAQGGPSENATRTSSTTPLNTDRPSSTRGPSVPKRTVRAHLADCLPNLVNQLNGSKPQMRTNKRRTGRTLGLVDCPRLPGGLSARCGQSSSSPSWGSRSTPPSLCPISQINQGITTKS